LLIAKRMREIRVIMLAGQGESSTLMFNGIKDHFLIEQAIIEEPVSRKQLLKWRAKRLGLMNVVGQIFFMAYNILWLKRKSRRRIIEIKREKNLDDNKIDENIISRVSSVNSKETIRLLKKYQPDVVVVNGTRIIKEKVLESVDALFVNTHAGITPKYRGAHGGYWALTENDPHHCGVTVHLIDTGIDTGGILYQDLIDMTDKDNFNTYPYLQLAAAIPLMNKAISDVADKTYEVRNVDLQSRLWSHPTILEYLKHRIMQGVK